MFHSRISPCKFFIILVVVCVWGVQYVYLLSHRSHLCESTDMPCEKASSDCLMKYYKLNSTDCRDMTFDENQRTVENNLGKVHIESYHYNLKSYKQTAFNLSFTNITWTHFKFRFKQESNDMKNTCREFFLAPNSSVKSIFYDCLWSNENYEGKTFSFEYQATRAKSVSYKKYTFQVPFAKHIKETTDLAEWEIFTFVEMVKNSFGLTTFILHWQPLPAKFSTSRYALKVYSNDSGQEEVIYSTNVTCYSPDDCKYYYNKWYGNVQFGIQPICGNASECYISKTAVFLLGGANAKPLLIGIVSFTTLVPATIYLLYLLRNYMIRRSKKWPCPVPKMLVIFTPSLSSHVNVVLAMVEYLKMYCGVEPLIDELNIFQSKSKDPFKWCNETLKSVEVVMVVASPYYKYLRLGGSVYQNTDVLLLRLLRERLASREDKIRCFLAMLPYCSERDIPGEAVNLRRFAFPDDLNKMLRFIHKDRSLPDCFSPGISGGKETYKLLGTKLSSAISEAQSCLRKNRSEYERMIKELREDGEDSGETLLKGMDQGKESPLEYRPRRINRVMELAEGIFGEFPGRLDNMNLSGEEEGEGLMGTQRASGESDAMDLDVLEL